MIHFLTKKGKGLSNAQSDPENFHGVGAKNDKLLANDYELLGRWQGKSETVKVEASRVEAVKVEPDKVESSKEVAKETTLFADFMVQQMIELATEDETVVAIVAGMSGGTGMTKFGQKFKDRLIDVGMAEQHATTMAAGLAKGGCKPFFAVYSTFLQRAFDQVIHDVCINNLNVVFLIDRAGTNGADGVTHQGVYDIAYLTQIPNMVLMSPKDGNELKDMIVFASRQTGPVAIRYPKNFVKAYDTGHAINFEWEWIRKDGNDVVLIVTGNRTLDVAVNCQMVDIVYATFLKPIDQKMIVQLCKSYKVAITIEDGQILGGFGQQVVTLINQFDSNIKCRVLGHRDEHIVNLDQSQVFRQSYMDVQSVQQLVDSFLLH